MELSVPVGVTLQFNVTGRCGPGAKTKRDASTTRECVSHLREKGKWPPLPRIFDLLLVALKEKWSTGARQSAGATGLEQERTDTSEGFLAPR